MWRNAIGGPTEWADRIFSIKSANELAEISLEIFAYQSTYCPIYAKYLALLGISPAQVSRAEDIPFLPIEFFKNHEVSTVPGVSEIIFSSSGTTGAIQSHHHVADVTLYRRSFRNTFERFYGLPKDWAILALLPAYAEREGSSLIYMVDDLIQQSAHPASGYFLYNHDELYHRLEQLRNTNTRVLLIGVTFALLDFIENYPLEFPQLIVMETGGMKGRKRELVREEVHERLRAGFGVASVHAEYGMTELLSQAYSSARGIFRCPPWMKVYIRDTEDPFSLLPPRRTGAINIVDLANIYSCSFIATQDLGRLHIDDSFEVLGRFDQSDIRGCNLLVQ